jgi:SulP family sulfate permease
VGDERVSPFQPRAQQPLLHRTFPVTEQVPDYPRRNLKRDLVAGVTVAALAIPSAMAYAEIAGLEPIHGLYALLLPAVAYMVFGSSRQLIIGPEGSLAVLVATAVAPVVSDDPDQYATAAAMLAVLVATAFAGARLLRLGWLADYISRAVLVGYIHGVAVVLIVGQLGKIFGRSIEADDPLPQLAEFVDGLSDTHALTALVGLASIAVMLVLRWRRPKIPAALVVVIAGIAVSAAADLEGHGVAVIGDIPSGLPTITWPSLPLGDVLALVPAALGIFLVSFADGILTARSFAGQHGQRIDANQELAAFAAGNLAAGISQGFPVGASGSRTAVNDQMGGRTQVVGSLAAVVVAVVLLFLTAPVELLPSACLGAVIVGAAIGLFKPKQWQALARAGRSQVVVAGVATGGVVVFGVLPALAIAVLLSIVETVTRSAQPHDAVLGWVDRLGRYADVSVHGSARTTPGVVVYRLDDRLIFANARYVKARVAEAIAGATSPTNHLVFDAEAVSSIDATGAQALEELHASLEQDGIVLVVARLKQPVRAVFDSTGLTATIGPERFHPTVQSAVAATATTT